ncbi:Fur family transcriptional regulator [Paenibacillus phoenicis]|uniref:Fur family transcriptional regulator, ferric uptake regulator n=3 Tax=Paenibacillus TaxID=44249 RepID=R9LHC7_9BACL|nr:MULTISPECIES: Fur family transcriptional regulator [Paenibacillus]EES72256.1 ferric uptake regulation protein [Paenibacillus sp. oral taxon 786 str. D14]EOS58140.1 fur family transcriptional regulator, ferric uptake regulator [Paenibacillus barengoltzii G22]MCT2195231.1 transcriptional repressor [Paenibacillus sp. p3-SID1389]MDU0329401.1 Fur family transcriptional regulator [Paenibacillus sp. 3LSP]MEA3569965.1 Fur family transcriptional regulator [Paenibacillus phoenicis]
MEAKIEKIKQQLQSHGYKLTPQREATVRVLLENEDDHLSAEDVFMLVKDKAPEIGLATVYRTLELLSELHVVEKINFGDGVARYDLRTDTTKHHHHHLICVQCGAMDEIREDWLGPLEERLEKEFNFTVLDHRLDFQGICYRCKDKNNDSPGTDNKK